MSPIGTIVKNLASNDALVREQAFGSAQAYLASKAAESLPRLEIEKLCKGLYFAMWFCDKPRPQQLLAEQIGLLFSAAVSKALFPPLARAFWAIMAREWPSVDQWRVDKYYLLMRRVLRHCLLFLQRHRWDPALVALHLLVLLQGPLSGDPAISVALPYHLCDIYLDELALVMFAGLDDLQQHLDSLDQDSAEYTRKLQALASQQAAAAAAAPVTDLISCFVQLAAKTRLHSLREKCHTEVIDNDRLKLWRVVVDSDLSSDDQDEEEWKGF